MDDSSFDSLSSNVKINPNPKVYEISSSSTSTAPSLVSTAGKPQIVGGPLDVADIFDAIRDIRDPEHPHTLEELNVVREELITIIDDRIIRIEFTPTVEHCSLVSHIGLCLRQRLWQYFPAQQIRRYKIDLLVTPGSHQQENEVNKQINDKERVAAALDNPTMMEFIGKLI